MMNMKMISSLFGLDGYIMLGSACIGVVREENVDNNAFLLPAMFKYIPDAM